MAVSAAVMVPIGAQADVTVYGRINNVIEFKDPGGNADTTTDISGIGSRFGVKANSDLGNGLMAHGHYEFGTTTDKKADGIASTRIATVGMSGGFGKVTVGNQGNAFYGNVHVDNSLWEGGIGAFPGSRSSNTIKYSNAVGPVSLQVDLRLNGKQEATKGTESLAGDGGGIGLQAVVTDNLTLGFAFDTEDKSDKVFAMGDAEIEGTPTKPASYKAGDTGPESDWVGVSAMATLGQFWGSLAWANNEVTNTNTNATSDTDYTQLWAGLSLTDSTSALIGYGQSESEGSDSKPSAVTVGLSHNFGGGLRLWYEGQADDPDESGKETEAIHRFGFRFDF